MDKYYVGTELKLKLTITCAGFNMDTDDWTATVNNFTWSTLTVTYEYT